MRFGSLLTPPSSYAGELPNSRGRTLTDKSYVIHGIRTFLKLGVYPMAHSYRTRNLEIAEIGFIHPKVPGKEAVGIYKGMGAYHKIT